MGWKRGENCLVCEHYVASAWSLPMAEKIREAEEAKRYGVQSGGLRVDEKKREVSC